MMTRYLTVAESKAIAIMLGADPKSDAGIENLRDPDKRAAGEALADALKAIDRP